MSLVSGWLNGIGLQHAVPSFQAAGIVTPAALAELDLTHYEALGVTDASDRRKLFYLVQRIKMAKDQDEEDEATSQQREVDEMLAKTTRSKLILHEDDPLSDADEEGIPEPKTTKPKGSKTVRSSRRSSVTTTRKKRTEEGSTKENRPASKASNTSTRALASLSGTTSASTSRRTSRSSLATKKPVKKKSIFVDAEDDDIENPMDTKEDDSEYEDSSADEAPPTKPTARRMSARIRSKKEGRDSDISFQNDQDDDSSVASSRSTRSRSSTGSQPRIPLPRGRSSSGSRSSIGRRSIANTKGGSDNESSNTSGSRTRSSALAKPRSGRFESKIQNPGASARTGKQLSSIPSDSIAPMSPLVDLPVSRMDAAIRKQQELEEVKKATSKASARLTRQRSNSLGGSQSGSDSDSSRQRRTNSLSGSDSETSARRKSGRKSIGSVTNRTKSMSGSDSESSTRRRSGRMSLGSVPTSGSSVTRKSRSSLGGGSTRPDMSSTTRTQSLRKLGTSSPEKKERQGRQSLPALSVGDSSAKAPVFVHGAVPDASWAAQVSQLREENDAEHELFAGHCLDTEEDMRIRVLIRKRPMSNGETVSGKELDVIHPLEYDSYGRILVYQPKTRVDLTKEIETVPFAFDNVFDETSTNVQIYKRTVRSLLPGYFEGTFASVFAYGQTGSGKTYTMMGSNITGINAGNATDDPENLGLYYMAAQDVFEMANEPGNRHLSVGASLFEIYGGKLFDLLNDRKPVKCLENHRGKVCFPGLSEHPVESARELMDVIEAGALKRSTGTTSKNADSSRSHAVLQLSLRKDVGRQKNVEHGRLTFIDLAGSERGADTSKASRTTRLEGAEINTSLLALKEVIRALATGDSMAHIPFRGSKLTQVLKESFVGKNARCVMVACIAPNNSNCEHTLNTLRYADRVKERDSETGSLPAGAVSERSRGSRRLSRSASAPVQFKLSSREEDDDEKKAEDSVDESITTCSVQEEATVDRSVDKSAHSELLDDLLDTFDSEDDNSDILSAPDDPLLASTKSDDAGASQQERKVAVESLISSHRSIMTDLLGMVKHEMILVNETDGDRDKIDSYVDELESIHEQQLSLISTLRQNLFEYQRLRGASEQSLARPAEVLGMLSDDDSFEDLRD